MKRLSKLSISAILGLSVFSAQAVEELVVWEDLGKSVGIELAARAFGNINNCKVIIEEKVSVQHLGEYEKALKEGDSIPDVYIVLSDRAEYAAENKLCSPLNRIKAQSADYLDKAINSFTVDGQVYAAPRSIEALVVYYNKALLEYPFESMQEYINFNEHMSATGKYGLIAKFDQFYIGYSVLAGNGAYVFGLKNNHYNKQDVGLFGDSSLQGLKTLMNYGKYLPREILSPDGWDMIDTLFNSGKAAAVINGPWALGNYAKAGVDYGVAPLPKLSNGKTMRPFYGAKGYVVSSKSKHKDLAEKFIEFINQPDYALIRYSATAELPPINKVLDNPLITNDDFANAVALQVLNSDPMPNIPEMGQVWGPMSEALYDSITGKSDPEKALKSAQEKIKF
ncbi:MAG: extracellular solute-binding protein [Succinivibrio sp.]